MRALILCLLLVGCSGIQYNVPISQFDELPPCEDGNYSYQGKGYNLTTYDSVDEIYAACGVYTACIINSYYIHVPAGPACKSSLAHELNHLVGNDWVDTPKIRTYADYH